MGAPLPCNFKIQNFGSVPSIYTEVLELENLAQKVPHFAIWLFYNNICSNYSSIQGRKTIQVRKIFRGGNYSGEETIQGRKLLIIRRFWPRKLFKGGKYSRKETVWENAVFSFVITGCMCVPCRGCLGNPFKCVPNPANPKATCRPQKGWKWRAEDIQISK